MYMYLFSYLIEKRMLTRFSEMRRLWIWPGRGMPGLSVSRRWLLLLSQRVRTSPSGWAFTHTTLLLIRSQFISGRFFLFNKICENLSLRKQYRKMLLILRDHVVNSIDKAIFPNKKLLLLCRSFCYKKIENYPPAQNIQSNFVMSNLMGLFKKFEISEYSRYGG